VGLKNYVERNQKLTLKNIRLKKQTRSNKTLDLKNKNKNRRLKNKNKNRTYYSQKGKDKIQRRQQKTEDMLTKLMTINQQETHIVNQSHKQENKKTRTTTVQLIGFILFRFQGNS